MPKPAKEREMAMLAENNGREALCSCKRAAKVMTESVVCAARGDAGEYRGGAEIVADARLNVIVAASSANGKSGASTRARQ